MKTLQELIQDVHTAQGEWKAAQLLANAKFDAANEALDALYKAVGITEEGGHL